MDQIYPPSKFPCSERIPLKSYFEEFASITSLSTDADISQMDEKLQTETTLNMMKISDKKKRKELQDPKYFDLTVEGEYAPKDYSKLKVTTKEPSQVPEIAKQLKTVQTRDQYRGSLKGLYHKHKQRQEPHMCQTTFEKSEETNMVPGSQFAVTIRVYHPFEFTDLNTTPLHSFTNLKFSHEIVALGCNTLADVRDKIICHTDVGLSVEVQDPKTEVFFGDAKQLYPSGFIFIENVFYNDTRKENNIDYSETILEWAKEKGIENLQTDIMQTTRIEDLSPRFGYPYVYQHQATCEHILVFSNSWLISRSDSLNVDDYPTYTCIQRVTTKHCTLCYAANAKWICTESERLPHGKTFLCQECLISYQYKDDKKIGTFKVYPYFDRGCIT